MKPRRVASRASRGGPASRRPPQTPIKPPPTLIRPAGRRRQMTSDPRSPLWTHLWPVIPESPPYPPASLGHTASSAPEPEPGPVKIRLMAAQCSGVAWSRRTTVSVWSLAVITGTCASPRDLPVPWTAATLLLAQLAGGDSPALRRLHAPSRNFAPHKRKVTNQ